MTYVDALVQPWSIAFLPGGDTLITERPGRLRIVRNGKLLPNPVVGVPAVVHSSQGGLLEVAPHPNFATNRLLYLTYSKKVGEPATPKDPVPATTALIRGRFENDQLTNVRAAVPVGIAGREATLAARSRSTRTASCSCHLGDRQVPPEGNLEAHPAQDLTNHHGKMIRLHDDGQVPADNPFVKQAGAKPEIWSYGHRNIQGLAIHPETGDIWANEHGPQGGDELNLIKPVAELRLAGRRLWRQLQHRPRDSLRHASRGYGAAEPGVGAVDRHLRPDDLHRRQVPACGAVTSSSAAWSASRSCG